MKVQTESFHLNGHIIGFRPQTQKLELLHKTLLNTLAVKGLKSASENFKDRLLRMQNSSLKASVASFFHLPLFCSCTNT